jgi:argininosuccinate lyase
MSTKVNKSPGNAPGNAPANTMWGGRFAVGPDTAMAHINASIDFDRRLYAQDIAASKAHCEMLVRQGIVSAQDGKAILSGLDTIVREIEAGEFTFDAALEDIHMNVEARLRDTIDSLDGQLRDLQAALIDHADAHAATVMPGYTHLQPAQPVTLGHHLLAYVEMFGRDRGRLADGRARLNECPLGAAALAGTSFPIDRAATAKALGFDRPSANSIDAVSDRDFALEFLGAGAILAVHLSRLAEEMVIWCTDRFAFVAFSDAFSTGSSIMPQKRNPDAAELVRGKCGRVIGALTALLVVMKGLPLAYGKDMQEDKEPVFDAADTLALCLAATTGMVRDMRPDVDALRAATAGGFLTATDLADWLVRVLGLPFRQAHHATGAIVQCAAARGCSLADLSLAEMQKIEPRITKDIYDVLSVEKAVHSRESLGGTAPARVKAAVAAARERFL